MRTLIRFQSSYSNSTLKFLFYHLSKNRILHFSSIARKRRRSSRSTEEIPSLEKPDSSTFRSLFNEITEILGSETHVCDKIYSQNSISLKESGRESTNGEEESLRALDVRENAEQEMEKRNVAEEIDVSAVVHQVAAVVRAGDGLVSMEERLRNLDVRFSSEVVEKVLKRCFKVPHLALGFFNWLKSRDEFQYTVDIFNTMLRIAGETKDFELIDNLMEGMEKYSLEKDIKTWTILISLYGGSKMAGKALLVYSKMRESGHEPDGVVYKTLISSLSAAGKPEIAMEFYREMLKTGIGLDMKSYKVLLTSLAGSGDKSSIFIIANDMIEMLKIPEHDVYHYILKSFCISGRIREALEFIHDLSCKGIVLGPEYFEILVGGLSSSDRIEDAIELVDVMKRKNVVHGKVYGIIINWCLRKNDISKALNLFQDMKETGYLSTTSTYTQLMQHFFRLKEYEKGFELYEEMLEKGIEVDAVAIMAVVVGYVRRNRVSEAWRLFRSMENKHTLKSFSVFIKELCKVSRTEDIIKVLNEMQDLKIVIPERLFGLVVSYLEKRGDKMSQEKVEKMKSVSKLFPEEGEINRDSSLVLNDLDMEVNFNHSERTRCDVEALPRSYAESDVREICKILSSSTNTEQIKQALEECCINFTPELVLEILRKCTMNGCAALHFCAWVGKLSGYNHTTETYNMAIKLAGVGKDFKHMRSLFYEMKRRGCSTTPETWTIMILQYGRAGLTEIALKLFREMKASNCKPTSNTYKYLILSLCGTKRRKVDEAITLFNEMIRLGYIPDKELLETYIGCLCKLGKLSNAKECIENLLNIGCFTTPLVYSMYIRALCRTGRLDNALPLLEEVGTERSKLDHFIYGSLIHGLLQGGRLEEALAKMDSMKRVGVNPTVHVYTSFIAYSFKENQKRRALEILTKMLQEGCEPTVATYSAVIHGFMKMGKVVDAWKIFKYMNENGPFPDFKAYSMFITCLCNAGKSEEALRVLSDMVDNGIVPSSVNFRTVFFGLNREGKQDLARSVMQQKLALIRRRKFQA